MSRESSTDHPSVPEPLRIAAAWSWRWIVIAIAVIGISYVLSFLSEITIALGVALLLAALLQPLVKLLRRWRFPRAAAAAVAMLVGVILVGLVVTMVITTVLGQFDELSAQTMAGLNSLLDWASRGPLHADTAQINAWLEQLTEWASSSSSTIAGYALGFGGSVGRFLSGLGITLFALFFFLYDGRTIWNFLLRLMPSGSRYRVDRAVSQGWTALAAYVKVTCIVAAVDAAGIFIGALILGVPLAPALGALVFLGAFIPIVGALVSGAVAVLVALVALGWVEALILLGVVIAVQQIESNLLQPILMGRAVNLHPLAVLLGIAVGISVAGIVGGILVIPILAFTKSFVEGLSGARAGDLPYPGAPVA